MDGLGEYYSELKKSEKDGILSESINIYMKYPGIGNRDREQSTGK